MKHIKELRTGLAELWQAIGQKHWRCAAQLRFDKERTRPMLAEMDTLDRLADEIAGLCAQAEEQAESVREPEEDDTWHND